MGHGIALVLALGGHRVRLTDSRPETLEQVLIRGCRLVPPASSS
jgi:3-hydroxyacyl-CoA dehydrogenase